MALKVIIVMFLVIVLLVLTMVSCGTPSRFYATPETVLLMATPELDATPDPALLALMLTQSQDNVDVEAAATAEMARALAQAILNSANATLGVAKTQDQSAANQLAADAQSTLVSAFATQSAAQTQDAIRQTQVSAFATSNAQALLDQQGRDALAAGTQTAVANRIATQTQSAVVTSEWYVNQQRQREEQLQTPITFLWMCCLPIFLALLAGLALWGLWRWLRIQQANQRILENEVLQAPPPREIMPPQAAPLYLDDSIIDHHPHLTKPDAQVEQWLDEVKTELENSEEKDKDDNANG